MKHAYTHYWKQETVQWNQDGPKTEGQPFVHTAGNQFDHVRPGDRIYAVSRDSDGDLMLIGRLTVGTADDQLGNGDDLRAILTQDQAEERLGELYKAGQHLVAVPDGTEQTTTSYQRIVTAQDTAANLEFIRAADGAHLSPKLETTGKLDRQTVRGVRRLTPEAAAYLDALLV